MKLKKLMATGLAAVSILGATATTVSAAKMQLAKKAYVYNIKGRRTKKHYAKNKSINVIGKKKIKGRKFYKIGKNKYILVKNFSKPTVPETPAKQPTQEPAKEPWQSKHLVDNEIGLVAQIKKAFTLQGDDKLEAYKEIAVQMNMSPDSVTASNQKDFEQKLQNYVNSMDSAKDVIENPSQQSIKDHDQQMKDEANKFGDFINNK
ncbi:SLAP domain-containing protein [Lactobacillus sp. B4005]|uniref:SLAP domain-containing protein n=1 Tax=Lactobacillus sp. B4005 TaxID=2818031 RepID=UPI00226A7887|nr:SLAP domain-containing protein [Lactobacillus sp. B4005]MCX8723100.1 SLAP domain-containing protein [Lactobacillus sp. B4005]